MRARMAWAVVGCLVAFEASGAIKSDTTSCTHAVRQGTTQISSTAGCVALPIAQQPPRATGVGQPWDACEAAVRARTVNPGAPIRTFAIRTGGGAIVGTATDRVQCEKAAWGRLALEAQTRTSGANVNSCQSLTKFSSAPDAPACLSVTSFIVSFQPAVTCPPPPGPEPRDCPAGMLGAWAQTATMGPAPTCAITWAPESPPAGMCFTLDRTATVSWTPPTRNTDGSALTNLAGHRVNYGLAADQQVHALQIADPAVTRYIFTDLATARWYFSVKAYATSGAESASSSTGTKVIP